ncbi:MAG TPA: response regulator [Thiolinea sp.]|nr:response regulator [Thiolinea sp.]
MEPILIVEDEPKIAELLQKYLHNSGFETHWIANGNEASTWLEHHQPILVVLDVMLPGKDGLEICKQIRKTSTLPVIMLTARVEEIDRLLGLELGADDYICKPFSPRELIARIKAVLRRTQPELVPGGPQNNPSLPRIRLSRHHLTASNGNEDAPLTLVEFELLETLLSQPGRIFSRQQLMERVYPDNRIVSDRTIDSHIKKLRRKIAALVGEQELIHSVYSVGYKYEG